MLVRALQRLENAASRVPFSTSGSAPFFLCATSLRIERRASARAGAGAGAGANCCNFSTTAGRAQFHRARTRHPVRSLRLQPRPAKSSPGDFLYPPVLVGGQLSEGCYSRSSEGSPGVSTRGYATAAGAGASDGSGNGKKRGRPKKKPAAIDDLDSGSTSTDKKSISRKRKQKSNKAKEVESQDASHLSDLRRNDALTATIAEIIAHGSSQTASTAHQNLSEARQRRRKSRKSEKVEQGHDGDANSNSKSHSQLVSDEDLRRTHALIETLYEVLSFKASGRTKSSGHDSADAVKTSPPIEKQAVNENTEDKKDLRQTSALVDMLYDVVSQRPLSSTAEYIKPAHIVNENPDPKQHSTQSRSTEPSLDTPFQDQPLSQNHDLFPDLRRNTDVISDIQSTLSSQQAVPLTPAAPARNFPSTSSLSGVERNAAFISVLQSSISHPLPSSSGDPLPSSSHAIPPTDTRQNESFIRTVQPVISSNSPDSQTPIRLQPLDSTDTPDFDRRRHLDLVQNRALVNTLQATISNTPSSPSNSNESGWPLNSHYGREIGTRDPITDSQKLAQDRSDDIQHNISADIRRQTALLDDTADVISSGHASKMPPNTSSQQSSTSSSPSDKDNQSPNSDSQNDTPPNDIELILSQKRSREHSRLWELYELADSPPDLASKVIDYQCRSHMIDDILRCMYLFETIQDPSEQDYLNIIRSILHDEKGSIAGGSSKIVDICREAFQRGKAEMCFHSAFFMHIAKADWRTASRLWDFKPSHIGTKDQLALLWQYHQRDMLRIPQRILDIIQGIKSKDLQLINHLEPLTNFLVFSVVSSKRHMGAVPMDMIMSIFDGLWDLNILDIRHLYWAFATLQQIDRLEGSVRSMLLYRFYRERFPGVKVPETTMIGFFVTLSKLNVCQGLYTLLSDSRRYYGRPPYYAYLHAMKIFSRQGKIGDVEQLLDMYIKDHGRPKDLAIITPLLNAYGILGKVDDVKKRIDMIRDEYRLTPDAATWNILLKAYAVNDDILGAFWVVDGMHRNGVQPNARTFTMLLNILARRRDISTLLDVFEKIKEMSIDIDRPLMKPVVAALCEDERYAAAEALAERITKLDLEGSATPVWNVLLSKYASNVDTHSVERVHKKMLSLGVVPDSMTYGALMYALTRTGCTNAAVLILERLHRSRKLHANEFHYAIILGGYLRERNRDMVHVIHKEIQERFGRANPSANFSVLQSRIARDLQAWAEQGGPESGRELLLEHAEEFLNSVMERTSAADLALNTPQPGMGRKSIRVSYPHLFYEKMMEVYAKHGALDKVGEMFEKLKERQRYIRPHDVHTTPHTFRVLMLAHLKAGNHDAVASCWKTVFEGLKVLATPVPESPSNTAQPIIPAFKFSLSYCMSLYMRSLASQGEYGQIKTLISDIEQAGFGLTTDNWSLYVKLLALSDKPEDQLLAFKYFEKLFIRNFPGWKEIVRGYVKRPRDAPPSLDLLEERVYDRGKPLNMLGKRGRRVWAKIRPDYMQPTYTAMVYLASAYLTFQSRAVVDGGAELSKLGEIGPRTLMTLGDMPVLQERYQKVLLKGQSPVTNAPPHEHDEKSPVWEGGILGPGGRRADTTPLELTSYEGRLVPKKNRPYIRPLLQLTSEPDEEDMLAILEADRRWRETLRERLTTPRESRDIDEIVRREDELDVEDERLYDIYPYNDKAFMEEQHIRRNESTDREHARIRRRRTPGGIRAIEERLKRGKAPWASS